MADRTVDVAIAGGGISGLYTAWRLLNTAGKPFPTVAVYEASDRVGGRLWTEDVSHSSARVELGAMRFPESHLLVSGLLTQFGVPSEPFPNLELQQMYLRGTPVAMGPSGPAGDVPFRLSGNESSNPFMLLMQCLVRLVSGAGTFSAEQWSQFFKTTNYEGRPFWQWGFWNLVARVVSNEGYQLMQSALGIESSIANWNATMSLPMMSLLIKDFIANKFNRPANGWSELPEKLAAALTGTQLESVNLYHQVREVRLTDDASHPFELEFAKPDGYTVRTARLVLALPRRAIQELRLDWRLQYRKEDLPGQLKRVGQVSAFRFYLSYESPWWQTFSGWTHGYSVTDLPIRQIFYGAGLGSAASVPDQERVLMASYADYHSVDYWRGLIYMEKEPPMMMGPPGATITDPLLESVEAQLRECHRYMLNLPKVQSMGYADWSPSGVGAAWHAWRPGGDLNKWIPEIRQPFADLPLYICGEAFSNFQGWVEGALGSAENMLEKCFHLERPSWIPQSLDLGP